MAASRKLLRSKLSECVAACFARHVPPGARVVLGLSGGLDSVSLLDVLVALRDRHPFSLHAIHVHHGLSPNADAWAAFCAQLCADHAVELAVHRVAIDRADPAGTEGAARAARHRVFAALDADFIVTAHQQDDQAETLLLQLVRGAGPKGLAAMGELQRRRGWRAALLRPLLAVAREDVRRHALSRALQWVDDESNEDTRYRRNAVRHDVMPVLAAHFPAVRATLARAAALQADAAGLLDELAGIDAATAIAGDRLDCAALAALSTPRARNLLRHFVEGHGLPMPSARQLDEALRQLLGARDDARVQVGLGGQALWRYRGGAYLVPPASPAGPAVVWTGEAVVAVPGATARVRMEAVTGAGIRRALLEQGAATLGTRNGGERLRLHAGGPHRSLKKLLQEREVPPWLRDRLPLLSVDGRLVWAAGIGVDADARAGVGEAGVLPKLEA